MIRLFQRDHVMLRTRPLLLTVRRNPPWPPFDRNSSALAPRGPHTCLNNRSDYLRRTMVENYTWLGALSLMMREQQFRVQ